MLLLRSMMWCHFASDVACTALGSLRFRYTVHCPMSALAGDCPSAEVPSSSLILYRTLRRPRIRWACFSSTLLPSPSMLAVRALEFYHFAACPSPTTVLSLRSHVIVHFYGLASLTTQRPLVGGHIRFAAAVHSTTIAFADVIPTTRCFETTFDSYPSFTPSVQHSL